MAACFYGVYFHQLVGNMQILFVHSLVDLFNVFLIQGCVGLFCNGTSFDIDVARYHGFVHNKGFQVTNSTRCQASSERVTRVLGLLDGLSAAMDDALRPFDGWDQVAEG